MAPGVEHQLGILTDLGCGFGQGFLWSRSLPAGAAQRWMLDNDAVVRPGAR